MRQFVLACLLTLALPALGENLYVAQTSAGGDTGAYQYVAANLTGSITFTGAVVLE